MSGLSKEEATNDYDPARAGTRTGNREQNPQTSKTPDEVADQKAQEILLTAMQRYAAAHTADSTTSTVDIPTTI